MNGCKDTLAHIHEAAMREFLSCGFEGASLRKIVKSAGVTTGAFYGYYSSKAALFAALVEPHAKHLMKLFMDAQLGFQDLPEEEKPAHMGVESSECSLKMLDYIYDHPDAFKLLITRAQGTPYESFIHDMVKVEVEATLSYMETLRGLGQKVPEISEDVCHMLVSGMFSALFEAVVHDLPKKEAVKAYEQIERFNTAGWNALFTEG